MDLMTNILIEIALFTLLGVLYYFYQKKKIIRYEEQKGPLVMGFILQSILSERGEKADAKTDTLIEALDDYLHNKTTHPPTALLKMHADSSNCSEELREIILEGLKEISHGKE